jgi:hypothetical protein
MSFDPPQYRNVDVFNSSGAVIAGMSHSLTTLLPHVKLMQASGNMALSNGMTSTNT